MKSLDLFSCIGCHALGFERAGIETVAFCEIDLHRRLIIGTHFPNHFVYRDIKTLHEDCQHYDTLKADILIGGPPCQETSVAAAIHGKRTGASLWHWMLRTGLDLGSEWIVVEQPPGNAEWEAKVALDLSGSSYHVARFEFGACDVGAPYLRRRVFLVACTSLSRLAVTRRALPSAIEAVKRAANARGDWDADQLRSLRVDARSAGEMDDGQSLGRRSRIEALGDSNPPHMAEAIGRAIAAAA